MKLLPEKWMPYAKSWVGLIGAVLFALASAWTGAPAYIPIAAAVVTAVGVYITPNELTRKQKERAERQREPAPHDDNLRA